VSRVAPLAIVFSALLLLVLSAAPAGASSKLCANTYGGDVIYARHLPCHRARRVVRVWARGYKRQGTPNVEALGFDCHGVDNEVEGLVVSCRRGRKHIVFYANVP
jgi:hypothetical protein